MPDSLTVRDSMLQDGVLVRGTRQLHFPERTISPGIGGTASVDIGAAGRWEILLDGLGNWVYVDEELVYVWLNEV